MKHALIQNPQFDDLSQLDLYKKMSRLAMVNSRRGFDQCLVLRCMGFDPSQNQPETPDIFAAANSHIFDGRDSTSFFDMFGMIPAGIPSPNFGLNPDLDRNPPKNCWFQSSISSIFLVNTFNSQAFSKTKRDEP